MNPRQAASFTRAMIAALFVGCVAIYWIGLSGPFLLDDLTNLAGIRVWLEGGATLGDTLQSGHGMFGRPLAMATFALSAIAGGFTPFAFKLGNLVIHLFCGAVVYALARHIARRTPAMNSYASAVALVVAALWLLHPLHASTVLYPVQRMAQLSTLGLLAGMWLYMAARGRLEERHSSVALLGLFAGIPLLTAAAFLCKENGILLPLLCLVLELGCFRTRPRFIKAFFGLYLVVPALLGMAIFIANPSRLIGGYVRRDFDWQERLLTQARALCDYLSQIVLPNPSRMGVYADDFPISTGLLTPVSTIAAILLLLGITLAAWRLRARMPFLFTGWGIFLAGHALESSILPLEMYFEHRNYLPMLGILYALVGLAFASASYLRMRGLRPGRIGIPVVLAVIATFAFATHGRARVWSNPESLAWAAATARPESMRAWLAVVSDATARGDYAKAYAALDVLTRSRQPRVRALGLLNRINLDCALRHSANSSDLASAVASRPARATKDEAETFDLLYQNTETPCAGAPDTELAHAAAAFADIATTQPDWLGAKAELRHASARFHARQHDWASALPQAKLAWQPGMPAAASVLLVQAQLAQGDTSGAEQTFEEARQRARPGDQDGLRWLRNQIDQAGKASKPKGNVEL
jgi:hypothetical protein